MAVKAPMAPVPPTPPSVPGVTLKDGGTAQETNVPRDKHQTGEEQLEDQARQSVAQGNGALSKTTQSKPGKPAQSAKPVDASGGASQENQASSVQVIPAQNGLNQENPSQQALADAKAAQTSQSMQADAPGSGWSQFASHGAVFWGAVLVFMAVVVWFGIRALLARKDGKAGTLSFADIDGAAAPVPLPGQGGKTAKNTKAPRNREAVETFADLRGLTPDEVLAKIAHDEDAALRAEMRQARAEAKERLQKAGRIPVNTSPPPQAAKSYRQQVTADLPKEKAKPKPPLKPRPKLKEEEQRFEVRI
ncbi:hypothetical protein [Selenomonas ruminantium]|uniref:Uncharacterized protein n=1 Tax=Selenomonas ruminantium TaxID=971 RepID=A0A1K1N5B5_SELRU|nr:hypothetical protein [Selenomonas ruminantium]SFW30539.1 hypothetical protein SAMN02910323_1183 [Selenomonas ruminantium]